MPKRFKPVWCGPEVDGITQSLLHKFSECKERFRLLTVHGLKEPETFKSTEALEWGNMWHEGEEALLNGKSPRRAISNYCRDYAERYPDETYKIRMVHDQVQLMFKHYESWWKDHPITKTRKPMWAEKSFCVPYEIPTGHTVYLRGKFDAVYRMGTKYPALYLQENKTKARIDEFYISSGLMCNMQVMFYLKALQLLNVDKRIGGCIYNVIRRPAKTTKNLNANLVKDPQHYFKRWQADITREDVNDFCTRCLDPMLMDLCEWWDWLVENNGDAWAQDEYGIPGGRYHSQTPFGLYKRMNDSRGDYYTHITTGKDNGLTRTDNLFPEL